MTLSPFNRVPIVCSNIYYNPHIVNTKCTHFIPRLPGLTRASKIRDSRDFFYMNPKTRLQNFTKLLNISRFRVVLVGSPFLRGKCDLGENQSHIYWLDCDVLKSMDQHQRAECCLMRKGVLSIHPHRRRKYDFPFVNRVVSSRLYSSYITSVDQFLDSFSSDEYVIQ